MAEPRRDEAAGTPDRIPPAVRWWLWLLAVLAARDAPIGQSPREPIWTLNKSRLYRYVPRAPRRHATPLLIVYSLINRPAILDLLPGMSLVEFLLDQGFPVYLLDWGWWGPEDRRVGVDDLVLRYLPRAARAVQRDAGEPAVNVLGYCMGGTLSLIWAALHPERQPHAMICLAAPVDFHEAGLFGLWLRPEYMDVDRMVDTLGLVPPGIVDFGAKMLRPLGTYATYSRLWDRVTDEAYVRRWQAMNRWVNEGVPFPGEAFRQWVKLFYRQNALVKGELVLGGHRVDLRRVQADLLNISAEVDDITPFESTNAVLDMVGSACKEGLTLKGGHISAIIGPSARGTLWPKLAEWLGARSGEDRAGATARAGA